MVAFVESESWYALIREVCVAFGTVLNRVADATIKKRELYTRPYGRLPETWEKVGCMGYVALRALVEHLRVEEV